MTYLLFVSNILNVLLLQPKDVCVEQHSTLVYPPKVMSSSKMILQYQSTKNLRANNMMSYFIFTHNCKLKAKTG